MTIQASLFDEYGAFVEKFKRKLTTDDCYTPEPVYNAVRDFAVSEYGLWERQIIRPFWPDCDYRTFDYSGGAVVIDNPPFSILSSVVRWYSERKIDFFLFSPALTLFSTASGEAKYLPVNSRITYDNGANITTSFVTSLGEWKIDTAPRLAEMLKEAQKQEAKQELPVYVYPDTVYTAKSVKDIQQGADIKIKNATFIRVLESQRKQKKAIFGGGFLISEADAERVRAERVRAERARAERARAEREKIYWTLSEAEQAEVNRLGRNVV